MSAIDETTDRGTYPRDFGPYRLERELGRGGMGIVYEATDTRLDRQVALKVLRTEPSAGTRSLERFRREAKACAKVRHENVVEVFGAEEVDGQPCYAMTLLAGRTLADLARSRELPSREALFRGLAGIADALGEIHREGIVHRDVTPGNIMVEPDGRMVLADFGLARLTVDNSLTQTGEALGTPYYMSPEQALGERDLDGRTDLYALGATLYEMIAGRRPFVADDTGGLLNKILREAPMPLGDRVPDLPPDVSRVVMKALEKRPDDRYANAAALRDDLLALADGRPVTGRPVPAAVHAIRRYRGAIAAALVLVAAVAGYALWMATRPAKLELLCWPRANVIVDGREVGMTPTTVALAPGKHEIVMELPGFSDFRRTVDLDAGEARTLERVLSIEDPRDPAGIDLLAASFDLPGLDEEAGAESPPSPLVGAPARPAPVSNEDLKVLLLGQFPAPPGSKVEVMREGQVLASRDFAAKATPHLTPELVDKLARLADGEEVTLTWTGPDGKVVTRSARIVSEVPEEVRRKIEKLEQRLAGTDSRVLCELRTRIYLANGLPLAALREACHLTDTGEAGPQTEKAMKIALERLRRARE